MSDAEDIFSNLDFESLSQNRQYDNIRTEIIRLIRMQWMESEEEMAQYENNNPNLMKDGDMKYSLYPFYINWKKIEERKNSYYDIFVHFGYFGAAVFSSFKLEDCPINLTYKNIIYTFSSLCYDFLINSTDKEKDTKDAQLFMDKLPDLNMIYKLIKKKIVMYKEFPMYILILKIYEIYYLYNVDEKQLIELLKYQYLLISYLKESEYKEIFDKNFSERVRKIYEKMVDKIGRQFELPSSKKKYFNHLKYVYQSLSKDAKDEANDKTKDTNSSDII